MQDILQNNNYKASPQKEKSESSNTGTTPKKEPQTRPKRVYKQLDLTNASEREIAGLIKMPG